MTLIFSNSEKESTYKAMQDDADNPIQKADELIKKLNVLTSEYPPTDQGLFAELFNELKVINDKYPSYFSRESASTNSEIERVESYALYLSYEETLKKSYSVAKQEFDSFINVINNGATYKEVIPALTKLNTFIANFFGAENMDPKYRSIEEQLGAKYDKYKYLQGALRFFNNFSSEKQNERISAENVAGLKAAVESFMRLIPQEKQPEKIKPKTI